MTTDKRGVSALLLQRQLGLAWLRDRVDDASQTPPGDGERRSGALARRRRG